MDYTVDRKDDIVSVIVNGNVVFEWDDEAAVNYPEDLTWYRKISEVFEAGFELGKSISK